MSKTEWEQFREERLKTANQKQTAENEATYALPAPPPSIFKGKLFPLELTPGTVSKPKPKPNLPLQGQATFIEKETCNHDER